MSSHQEKETSKCEIEGFGASVLITVMEIKSLCPLSCTIMKACMLLLTDDKSLYEGGGGCSACSHTLFLHCVYLVVNPTWPSPICC